MTLLGHSMHFSYCYAPRGSYCVGKRNNLRCDLRCVRLLLTPFQFEVATLHRRGFSRSALAAALGVSPGTVKVVLREIRSRLGPGWQRNPEYVWPEDRSGHQAAECATPSAAARQGEEEMRSFAAEQLPAGEVPQGRRLEFTGLQRFWLKPVLDRLEEEGALRLLSAGREGAFAPPWLVVAYHRRSVRPAVYKARDAEVVLEKVTGFLEAGLPARAAEVLERIETAKGLRGPWRKCELPGRSEIAALLREAFGEAGARAATQLEKLTLASASAERVLP